MATTPAHPLRPPLELVLAYVNTIDVEEGTDALAGGPDRLADWLITRRLVSPGTRVTGPEYRLALELRTGLRALALANNGGPTEGPDIDLARSALARLPIVARVDGVPLGPYSERPVPAALSRVVAGYAEGVASGEWRRLRRCPAEDCAWAFWDSSAKGARRWCTMSVCGNRAKARTYARRRDTDSR